MGHIYVLTNTTNGKQYVGQTVRPIKKRFYEYTSGKPWGPISYAVKKYGFDNFDKKIFDIPDEELNDLEIFMIEILNSLVPNGYNVKIGGGGGHLTEEHKNKISAALIGKHISDETRERLRFNFLGKKHTEETKKKMSEYHSNKKLSEEHKRKISESGRGKKRPPRTEEHTRKIIESRKGYTPTKETIEKWKKSALKTFQSEEFRKAQSVRMKEIARRKREAKETESCPGKN